jgi:hypothetical protein
MFLALAALFEFSFFALFFWGFLLLLVAGAAFDRKGYGAPKWYLLGTVFVFLAAYYWPSFTFFGPAHLDAVMEGTKVVKEARDRVVLWDVVSTWNFWQPVVWFFGIGLVYSMLEFGLTIRKAARGFAEVWQRFLATEKAAYKVFDENGETVQQKDPVSGRSEFVTVTLTNGTLIATAKANGPQYRNYKDAVEAVKTFTRGSVFDIHDHDLRDFFRRNTIISAQLVEGDPLSVEPKIDKKELAEHVGAWTFLWPAYLISLIIGDLFVELCITFANFLVSISGRVVKAAFRDVFTMKA